METNDHHHLHIAMLPWFAFGHINPFISLSNSLLSHGRIRISFLSLPSNLPHISSSLLPSPLLSLHPLPIPPSSSLPPHFDSTSDVTPSTSRLLLSALDDMPPQLLSLLTSLRPDVILIDFPHTWVPPLASQLGIKSVKFSVFSAIADAYLIVPSRRNVTQEESPVDAVKGPPDGFPSTPFSLSSPSCFKTFQARDLQYLYKRVGDEGETPIERILATLDSCDAMLYKTCMEMEGPYVGFLKAQFGAHKPILLAGPLVGSTAKSAATLDERWATWLDQFPEKSVIFCNFGSETYLGVDQIRELAFGLELTGLPFFLVLKFPTADLDCVDNDNHNHNDDTKRLADALPDGFLERVKSRGVVHTGWVQQQQILAHSSVGCYVCHSGFSSINEGLVNECQLVLVPQKGDQFLNAKLMGCDLKVGVEVNRRDADGYFGKEDIFAAIKTVMVDADNEPGKSIRENAKKLREILLNKEIQDEYIVDLVKELKALVANKTLI